VVTGDRDAMIGLQVINLFFGPMATVVGTYHNPITFISAIWHYCL